MEELCINQLSADFKTDDPNSENTRGISDQLCPFCPHPYYLVFPILPRAKPTTVLTFYEKTTTILIGVMGSIKNYIYDEINVNQLIFLLATIIENIRLNLQCTSCYLLVLD